LSPAPVFWLSMMVLYFFTLAISIPPHYYSMQTLMALRKVPLLMLSMVKALFQMKKKRTEFIHTPKSYSSRDVNSFKG